MPGIRETLEMPPNVGGAQSAVAAALEKMDDDLRELAMALLGSLAHSDRMVADAFADDGFAVSQNAVRNYRRRHHLHRFTEG